MYSCGSCGLVFHSRGLSEVEALNYYDGYRDADYFARRNAHEFFYTKKRHDALDEQLGSSERKTALERYLKQHGALNSAHEENTILDYAGGTGELVRELAGEKYVYDISGDTPVAGVTAVSRTDCESLCFSLIVAAQFLEHVTDPKEVLAAMLRLVRPGGFLYIEVPDNETFWDASGDNAVRNRLITIAQRSNSLNALLDAYGTFFRVAMRILPPFAYVPVREHLQYFTLTSLRSLAEAFAGVAVVDVSRVELLGNVMILKRGEMP